MMPFTCLAPRNGIKQGRRTLSRRQWTKSGFKPAKVVRGGSQPIEKVYSFSFEADLVGRVKARPADRNFRRARSRRAFTPAVILFIALPEAKDNIDPG